jgi:hypothetical protein
MGSLALIRPLRSVGKELYRVFRDWDEYECSFLPSLTARGTFLKPCSWDEPWTSNHDKIYIRYKSLEERQEEAKKKRDSPDSLKVWAVTDNIPRLVNIDKNSTARIFYEKNLPMTSEKITYKGLKLSIDENLYSIIAGEHFSGEALHPFEMVPFTEDDLTDRLETLRLRKESST